MKFSIDKNESVEHVYLCQVNESVSCGACCGLYNVTGLSRRSLETLMARRSEIFSGVPRTVDAIDDFQKAIAGWTPRERPYPRFHHCPFLGLIGDNGLRVGCLLHPAAPGNDGIDWRGLSYYGGLACRTYFCPTARRLPSTWLHVLRQTMEDWYLYGLVVTERRLLTGFFEELEKRIGRPIEAADFTIASEAAARFREFAELKMSWPFRRRDAPGPCNYFFENGEYPRPSVQRSGINIPLSRYENIFRELDSGFSVLGDQQQAERLLDLLFDRLQVLLGSGNGAISEGF